MPGLRHSSPDFRLLKNPALASQCGALTKKAGSFIVCFNCRQSTVDSRQLLLFGKKIVLPRLNTRTLRADVTESIRSAIIKGDISPGAAVNQVQIAEMLGVSRAPVREALRQLEEEGLIQNIPYKGAFVISITPNYIEELFSIRRILEPLALQYVIERAGTKEIALLRKTVDEMRKAVAARDLDRAGELDLQFHRLICQSAHHKLLFQLWKSFEDGVRLCLAHGHSVYQDPHEIVGTHPDILAAIEAKDVDTASQLLEAHIRQAGEVIRQSWSISPSVTKSPLASRSSNDGRSQK
jgi:DNA-binding GntR family transcriptional regulator